MRSRVPLLLVFTLLQITNQKYIYPSTWTLHDTDNLSQIASAFKVESGRCILNASKQEVVLKVYEEDYSQPQIVRIEVQMEDYDPTYGLQYGRRYVSLKIELADGRTYAFGKKSRDSAIKIDSSNALTLTIKTSTIAFEPLQSTSLPNYLHDFKFLFQFLLKIIFFLYLIGQIDQNQLKSNFYVGLLAWQVFTMANHFIFTSEYGSTQQATLFTMTIGFLFFGLFICGGMVRELDIDRNQGDLEFNNEFYLVFWKVEVIILFMLYELELLGPMILYSLLPMLRLIDNYKSKTQDHRTFLLEAIELLIILYSLSSCQLTYISQTVYNISVRILCLWLCILIFQFILVKIKEKKKFNDQKRQEEDIEAANLMVERIEERNS